MSIVLRSRDDSAYSLKFEVREVLMVMSRKKFRELLSSSGCHMAAPIFGPLSARLAEMQGWAVCKLSGSVGKAAELGLSDEVRVTNMSDLVDICRRITRVADIPLIVDADDGGGSLVSIPRTIRELEAAGVVAIELEDNAVPTTFYGGGTRHSQLLSKDEHMAKLRVAVEARKDPGTAIVARTSAFQELPLETAIERVRSYATTGVEAIMLPRFPPGGVSTIEAVHEAAALPLFILGLPNDLVSDEGFLTNNDIRIRYLPQLPYRMAVKAIYDALEGLHNGLGRGAVAEDGVPPSVLTGVTHTDELRRWEEDYGT